MDYVVSTESIESDPIDSRQARSPPSISPSGAYAQSLVNSPPRDGSMNRRIRPIRCTLRIAMFDRVDVNIVDVPLQVDFVPNLMLPVSPLPNSAFALRLPARGDPLAAGYRFFKSRP